MRTIYILLLFISVNAFSQSNLKKANELYDRHIYIEAAPAFEKYMASAKKENVAPEVYMKMGDVYYNLKDYYKAKEYYEIWYKKVGPNQDNSQGFQYYDTLRYLKEYDKASQVVELYVKEKGTPEMLNAYYEEKSRFEELIKGDTLYTIKNLELNSQYADFGGAISEGTFVFTSARNKEANKIYERDNTPYLAIYKADMNGPESFSNIGLFNEDLETPYHDATVSFSPNSKYIYFASSAQDNKRKIFTGDKRNYFNIYRVDLTAKKLKKELLPFNGETYSSGHPFVTEDGTKLFFASDMPGGFGKADIYVCDIYEDGTYSKPRNLGPLINSIVDDYFPFYKDNTLYFSSEGHVGFGGLDVYKTNFQDGIFGAVINLGPNINSNADDFAYVAGLEPDSGYFSSDRAGGKGGDDIYSFKYNVKECLQTITGTVYDLETKETLSGAKVTAYINDGQVHQEVITDEKGAYTMTLNCETTYTLEATKAGYGEDALDFSTDLIPGHLMDMVDFRLKDLSEIFVTDGDVEKIRIDPIYFEYYRYNINDVAAIQLKRVIEVMESYPEMIIKIESHTDQRGTDYFNKTLSSNRANSTKDWLIENGIDPSRIESAIGYGESRPIHICDEDGKNCTELEYSENRRSEFIVVSR